MKKEASKKTPGSVLVQRAEMDGRYRSLNWIIGLSAIAIPIAENAVAKGFRKVKPKMGREDISSFVSNLHGEVSEYWEAYREDRLNKPCDKAGEMMHLGLNPLTCAEEELADVIIRAIDTAMAHGIDIQRAIITKHLYNTTRPHRRGGKKA